jgi:Ca2+-binding EF-hand superfamily protein
LFDELDDDHDGQVSFEEFLHGLFMARDKGQESDSHSDGFFNGLEVIRHGTSFPVYYSVRFSLQSLTWIFS